MKKSAWQTTLLCLLVLSIITGQSSQQSSTPHVNSPVETEEQEPDLGPVQPNEFGIEEFLTDTQVELLHKFYFFEFKDTDQFTQLVLDYEADKKYISEDEDFEDDRLPYIPWFIFFYTGWCPHCKKVAPNWKTFTSELGRKDKDRIRLAAVNCEDPATAKICKMVKVSEYPSLYVFESDKAYKYTEGAALDMYEDFSTFEGYKKKVPTKVERNPGAPLGEQYPQLQGLIRYWNLLQNTLPYGWHILPVSTSIVLFLLFFVIFGAVVLLLDILSGILSLLGCKRKHPTEKFTVKSAPPAEQAPTLQKTQTPSEAAPKQQTQPTADTKQSTQSPISEPKQKSGNKKKNKTKAAE